MSIQYLPCRYLELCAQANQVSHWLNSLWCECCVMCRFISVPFVDSYVSNSSGYLRLYYWVWRRYRRSSYYWTWWSFAFIQKTLWRWSCTRVEHWPRKHPPAIKSNLQYWSCVFCFSFLVVAFMFCLSYSHMKNFSLVFSRCASTVSGNIIVVFNISNNGFCWSLCLQIKFMVQSSRSSWSMS
jgi:hypothetical protein